MSRRDVVIVGGGLAGLTAALELKGHDVVVLEATSRVGGRVKSVRQGRYWLNLGAHLLRGPGFLSRKLAEEYGLQIITPAGRTICVALHGKVVSASRPEELVFRLPLSLAARASLVRTGIRLRLAERRARRADDGLLLTSDDLDAMTELPVDPQLDAVSFGHYLGSVHPDVERLMRVSTNRAGGELDDTSAHYGVLSLFGAFGARRANIANGTERLVDELARAGGATIETGCSVASVQETGSGVSVEYADANGSHTVNAAACVVAVPAPLANRMLIDLPTWKHDALSAVRYSPYVVTGIFTTEAGPMPWDGIYAMAAPEESFSMLFNAANALRDRPPREPGGALVVYVGGDRARAMLPLSSREIIDRFTESLVRVFPGASDVIGDVTVAKWEYGAPIPPPGRARHQAALAASVGRVAFAGDYHQYGNMDSAMRSGQRAGRIAANWLRRLTAQSDQRDFDVAQPFERSAELTRSGNVLPRE